MTDQTAAPEATQTGDPAKTTAVAEPTTAVTGTTTTTEPITTATVVGKEPTSATPDPHAWATKREAYANGDPKLSARLARYSSEKDVIDALIAAQNKISSGGLKAPLPENPTPEEIAAWRAENGVPLTPKDYGVKVPDGVDPVQTEEFLATAHELNMTPAQVEKMIAWKASADEKALTQRAETDAAARQAGTDELRQDWGPEYKLNINLVTGLLDAAPQGIKEQLMGARLANGTLLGNDPTSLRWLASLAREINPTATVVPGSGVNAVQAIQSEMQSLQKLMGDRNSEYWKGPTAEALQKRFRDLAAVSEKVNK